jgi:Fe-S cluster assembly iron-binding protein IscA
MSDRLSPIARSAHRADRPTSRKQLLCQRRGGGSSFDAEPEDILIERAGAKVLVDSLSLTYLAGSEIDYVDDLMSASFKIKNPNATAACGCGTSFSV